MAPYLKPCPHEGIVGDACPMMYVCTKEGIAPDIHFILFVVQNMRWDAEGYMTHISVCLLRFLAEMYVAGTKRIYGKNRVFITDVYHGNVDELHGKQPTVWLNAHRENTVTHSITGCHGKMHRGVGKCEIDPLGEFHTSKPLCSECYRTIYITRPTFNWRAIRTLGPFSKVFLCRVFGKLEKFPLYHVLVGMASHVIRNPYTPVPNEKQCAIDGRRVLADRFMALFLTTPRVMRDIFSFSAILGPEAWRLNYKLQ